MEDRKSFYWEETAVFRPGTCRLSGFTNTTSSPASWPGANYQTKHLHLLSILEVFLLHLHGNNLL